MWQYSIDQLQALMNTNHLTSVELVSYYLAQIQRLNDHYHAVACVNPAALEEARARDLERASRGPRSDLHGIPILVKDNIFTQGEMPTTASSYALRDFHAPQNALVIEQLIQAGAIILGKTNLSEWAYFMSEEAPSGYGSLNGQVRHPYDDSIDPYGSSTGSAVALALLMSPLAIGTETNGSLMAPAYQTYTVAMKPTYSLISQEGIIPLSLQQDTAGPMARSVADLAKLVHFMQTNSEHRIDFLGATSQSVIGKKIAILRLRSLKYSADEEEILLLAKAHFENAGIEVTTLEMDDQPMDNYATLLIEFKHDLNDFFAQYGSMIGIHSLEDLIHFNEKNSSRCLRYGQTILQKAQNTTGRLDDPEYLLLREALLKEATSLKRLMKEQSIDAVISTQWQSYAPITGMPSITLPARYAGKGTPRGLVIVGQKWSDASLLAIAHVYEKATRYFIPPESALT